MIYFSKIKLNVIDFFVNDVQVFPNLKKLSLDNKSIMILQLELSFTLKVQLLIMHSFPPNKSLPTLINMDLERLDVHDSSLKELFAYYRHTMEELENMKAISCGDFIRASPSSSFATFFWNIKTLVVYNCNGLVNLVTPSVAKNMAQLVYLTMGHCEKLKEIVVRGEQEDGITYEIVFINFHK